MFLLAFLSKCGLTLSYTWIAVNFFLPLLTLTRLSPFGATFLFFQIFYFPLLILLKLVSLSVSSSLPIVLPFTSFSLEDSTRRTSCSSTSHFPSPYLQRFLYRSFSWWKKNFIKIFPFFSINKTPAAYEDSWKPGKKKELLKVCWMIVIFKIKDD